MTDAQGNPAGSWCSRCNFDLRLAIMPFDPCTAAHCAPLPLPRAPLKGDTAAFIDWLVDIRSAGPRRAAPVLVLALEEIRRSEIPILRRLKLLRLITEPVLKLCEALPKPAFPVVSGTGGARRPLTLEQRLLWLLYLNLTELLQRMDRRWFVLDGLKARRRLWVVQNLFRFFGRLVRYSAQWGAPMPASAWRDLHDLHLYLRAREAQREAVAGVVDLPQQTLDPEIEYRALLLFGLAETLLGPDAATRAVRRRLHGWAEGTQLVEPGSRLGGSGMFLVVAGEDSAPRREPKRLTDGFRGWVLEPPLAFFEVLNRILSGESPDTEPVQPVRRRAHG